MAELTKISTSKRAETLENTRLKSFLIVNFLSTPEKTILIIQQNWSKFKMEFLKEKEFSTTYFMTTNKI